MKKKSEMLPVFFAIAFGGPVILGIIMGIAFNMGQNVSAFPLVWMFLPATAAMTATLAGWKRRKAETPEMPAPPKAFYLTFIIVTALVAVLTVCNVFLPQANLIGAVNLLIYLSCLVSIILIVCMKKSRRAAYGLMLTVNWKKGLAGAGIFVLLYLLLSGLSVVWEWISTGSTGGYMLNPMLATYIGVALPLNLLLSFTAFFGEEYGWRYFLQPKLQERFGVRRGVILLGLLWGIWHLPINLFYYSPQTSLMSILVQLAGCVGMGIFFGWVYMRTQNVWAVTLIHFLNNNLGLALFGVMSNDVNWSWPATIFTIACYLIVYLPFLLTREYRSGSGRKSKA